MGRPRKYETEEERLAARRASRRKWNQNNPNYLANYYQDNKEEILARVSNYYQDNKEEILARISEYNQTLQGMCVNKSSTYRAIDREKFGTDESSVTAQQMKELIELHPKCFYCGCEDLMQLGLDRIDNNRPHTVDNCIVACWNCNNERRRIPFEDFLKMKGLR